MINSKMIDQVKKRLVEAYDPLAIYLFGSYAWGTPHNESDLDLLVVVPDGQQDKYSMLVKGHRVLFDLDISKDLVIYTKEEFEDLSKDITTLGYRVKEEGRKIYG